LYTEQLHEFTTMPIFSTSNAILSNALYNGRFTATNFLVTDTSRYNNTTFNYHASLYPAISYCAYKNRGSGPNGKLLEADIKWYLPAQAQLLAMWIAYESYKTVPTADFYRLDVGGNKTNADIFWSSSSNYGYPHQAQLINFRFGNVGHFNKVEKYWARCVRDGSEAPANPMVRKFESSGFEYPGIYFDNGMPAGSFSAVNKNGYAEHDESDAVNQTVFGRLRVAKQDAFGGSLVAWSLDNCALYSEPEAPVGSWRVPTQRELQATWVLQYEIKNVCPSFDLLSDYYYWSGTNAYFTTTAGSHAWTVFGSGSRAIIGGAGNLPHQLKSTPLKVRCVAQF